MTEASVMLKSLLMAVRVSPERTSYDEPTPGTQISVGGAVEGTLQDSLSGSVQSLGTTSTAPSLMTLTFEMLLYAAMSQMPELYFAAMLVSVSPLPTV